MRIDQSMSLDKVLAQTTRICLYAEPIAHPTSPLLPLERGLHEKLRKAIRISPYRAYEGIGLTPREIFIVKVLRKVGNNVIIENRVWSGAKKQISKKVIQEVEAELVYPVLLGRDVGKYEVKWRKTYSVIIYDPKSGKILPEHKAKVNYPRAFSFYFNFKHELESAANYKNYGKGQPFYFIYRMEDRVFAPAKVVWREVGTRINAAVITTLKDQQIGEKIPLPDYTCVYVPLSNEDEAYYLCAILNSMISRLVTSYVHLHPDPHVLEHFYIPKYVKTDDIHSKLVKLSKIAHKIADRDKGKLAKVEEEIDKLVAQLYSISEDELKEIRKCLAMLEGEEYEEEFEETVELPPSMPDVSLRNNVVEEKKPFNVDVVISNPLEEPLRNVYIKLTTFDNRTVERNFEEVKGEVSFPLSFEGLKAGEYKVKLTFEYVIKDVPKKVEKELTIYVKGPEVKHAERSFKIEDLGV